MKPKVGQYTRYCGRPLVEICENYQSTSTPRKTYLSYCCCVAEVASDGGGVVSVVTSVVGKNKMCVQAILLQ